MMLPNGYIYGEQVKQSKIVYEFFSSVISDIGFGSYGQGKQRSCQMSQDERIVSLQESGKSVCYVNLTCDKM